MSKYNRTYHFPFSPGATNDDRIANSMSNLIGQEIVITAEVAVQVELVTDVAAFAEELFSDPGSAIAALGSIGADMTVEEREEATEMVVATVVATGAALNAVSVTAASVARTAGGTTPSPSGGGSSGGPGGGDPRIRRRKP